MSRPLRIEYKGAWYHIMNRGINHQAIYYNDKHRNLFLTLLKEISEKYFVEIHAYCLMDNHYHLLARTPLPNLGRAMRHLDGVYTKRFNTSEKRDGSIFRGRYHAILIEEENYLIRVSRYIHLNPVSAKICAAPCGYPWSSYLYYRNNIECEWLNKKEILKYFNIVDYDKFTNEGIDEEIEMFYSKYPKTILGSKEFINSNLKTLTEQQKLFCQPSINKLHEPISIETIINVIKKYFNVDTQQLKTFKQSKKNIPRTIAIFLAKQYGQLTHQEIATYFTNAKPNSISTMIKRFECQLNDDHKLQESLGTIKTLLEIN